LNISLTLHGLLPVLLEQAPARPHTGRASAVPIQTRSRDSRFLLPVQIDAPEYRMKTTAAVLFLSILAIGPRLLEAQTLDELQHPLLPKGKAAVSVDYDGYAIERFGSWSMLETSFEPRQVVLPTFAVGLARAAQLTVSGAYQFPTTFLAPTFGSWDYFNQKTLVRIVSGDLLFRPGPNFEVGATAVFGQSRQTSNYPRTFNVDAVSVRPSQSTVVSAHGTWLSSARAMTNRVRADLDGLLRPLLQRHRWKIDGEAMARWDHHDSSDSDEAGEASDTSHGASRDFRLRLGAARGITDRIQLAADGYWHPPFARTQDFQLGGFWGSYSYGWPQRFDEVFGGRLEGRWRPVRQVETFATGAWEHQRVTYTPPTSGTLNYGTSTFTTGATWLSRPPRGSETLTADLSGLYHPLVEPKQVKVDGFVYLQAYRTESGVFDVDTRVYRLQATVGILPWLQARAYAGALLSRNYMSDGKFERSGSYGGELRLRVKNGAELYGTLEQHRAGFVDQYPMFVLASGDDLGPSVDFLHPYFEGTYTAHLGVRFVF
jgi:hypothetical protein